MMRTIAIALCLLGVMFGDHAVAQAPPAESDDARYSYNRVEDGFLRLDSRSGVVSLCNRRAVGWSCEIVPDDRSVLDSEIGRLRADNAALKKALLDRGLPLPSGVRSDAVEARDNARDRPKDGASANDQSVPMPSHADVERVKVMVQKVWRQLVDMIMTWQKEVMKKT